MRFLLMSLLVIVPTSDDTEIIRASISLLEAKEDQIDLGLKCLNFSDFLAFIFKRLEENLTLLHQLAVKLFYQF